MGNDGRSRYAKILVALAGGHACRNGACGSFLIFGGVLERLPELRVCFAHAGGSLIPTIGRLEHGFNCRPDLVAIDNPITPRHYLGKIWVDSATHDPQLFRYILEVMGEDKVCLGSDYPFPLGDLEIGSFIEKLGLSEETMEKIFTKIPLPGSMATDQDLRR